MRSSLAAFACLLSTALLLETVPAQKTSPDLFAASRKARDNGRYGMLLRQFRADEPLPEHHEAGLRDAAPVYQEAREVPAGYWVWQRPYWFVFRDGPGQVRQPRNWGPEAACGAPDTREPGDHGSAWATREQDRAGEWLMLEYAQPVRATALELHETYNPGALAAVAILTPQGELLELWRNREVKAAPEPGRVLQVDLPIGFEVERVMLSFASDAVPGWNEIDAVGLRDDKGRMHWADRAEASSSYAEANGQAAAVPVARFAPQVVLPRVQLPALEVQLPALEVQRVGQLELHDYQRVIPLARQARRMQLGAVADETPQLRQRVADLEARIKQLEAELARARARK